MDVKLTNFPPRHEALSQTIRDIEKDVAELGWDQAPRLYALVDTAKLLEAEPNLPDELRNHLTEISTGKSDHFTAILQEGLIIEDIAESLEKVSWPESVTGVALCVERITVPPSAEKDIPDDPDEVTEYLLNHAEREDIRVAAGVLRSGESWSALRVRPQVEDAAEDDSNVAQAPNIVPDLTAVLAATLD